MKKRLMTMFTLTIILSGQLFAQLKVEGYVKDVNGEALPGVNITIKRITKGTVTNLDGYYSLSDVSADATLVYSFIGMLTEEIEVGGKTTIDVTLIEDIQSLDEVVVIGYGTVKRANLTGAVADINSDELEDIPVANLATTLEGKMAGVKVGLSTGKPGASTSFQIRESSSFGVVAQTPLFVIDGVVYDDQSRFDLLDPSEVESISILKDAAAAVYGPLAAGGVVLVKTKRGLEGKTRISYSGSYGLSKATSFPEMLSAYEHASMMNDILDYQSRPTPSSYYAEDELEHFTTNQYNWLDDIWKDSHQTRHTLNVSGGTQKVKYFIGGSYFYEDGSIPQLNYNRYSVRANIDADVTENLTVSSSINLNQSNSSEPYYSEESQSGVMRDFYKQLLTAPRWLPPTIDGHATYNNMVTWNPYALIESGSYKKGSGTNNTITGALEYRIKPVQGLKVNAQISYDISNSRGKRYSQDYPVYNFVTTGSHRHILTNEVHSEIMFDNRESLTESSSESKGYQFNASISYGRMFGNHDINALLVYEQSEKSSNGFTTDRTGATIEGYEYLWAFSQSTATNGTNASETGRLSYIGRLNYSYARKYIFEGTFRYDASQIFASEDAWGFFPAVSAGWVVSEEDFFRNIPIINFLKIRGSAGRLGNDRIKAFQYQLQYSANQEGAIFGNSLTNAIEAKNNGVYRPNITWQKTNAYNIGADIRMLNNSIDFGFNYYYKFTFDIFNARSSSVPSTAGYTDLPDENYGQMYAKGVEFELRYNGNITREISYYIKGLFSYDKHRKLRVYQNPEVIGRWDDQLLNDPSNQPGWICTGIIRTQEELDAILAENPDYTIDGATPELGMLNYLDIRGENYSEGPDGKIDGNDKTVIAEYTSPPYHYGFSLGSKWKGISLDLTFSGNFGHKVFVEKDEQVLPTASSNVFSFWGDYWTPENTDASMPRPYQYGLDEQVSTFWMRDGHTLRLSNLNLSYNLPGKLSEKFGVPQLRLYFSAMNLWTIISPFDYKDPSVSRAYDYPMQRTYNFGININL